MKKIKFYTIAISLFSLFAFMFQQVNAQNAEGIYVFNDSENDGVTVICNDYETIISNTNRMVYITYTNNCEEELPVENWMTSAAHWTDPDKPIPSATDSPDRLETWMTDNYHWVDVKNFSLAPAVDEPLSIGNSLLDVPSVNQTSAQWQNTENNLPVESWMTNPDHWVVFDARVLKGVDEPALAYESWMTSPLHWVAPTVPADTEDSSLKIESWMLDSHYWNNKIVK